MEQKGVTFNHDFSSFLFPPKKVEREKENEVAKIVIKSHTFLFHPKNLGASLKFGSQLLRFGSHKVNFETKI